MISRHITSLVLLATATCLCLSGCTKDDSGSDTPESPAGGGAIGNFRTNCGTVFNGSLENPVDPDDGQRGALRYIGANLVSIKLKTGDQLIKLHGLDAPYEEFKRRGAETVINELIAEGDGFFYKAERDCDVTLDDGGQGIIGHIFSARGTSFSETLINKGYAKVGYDSCQGSLISSCYSALEEEVSNEIAGELEEFLWKPVSDSNGKLAVHSSPYETTVIVNGETGTNQGPGNGYGSLARFTKSGCAYGAARVRVVNSEGAAFLYKGQAEFTIPDGCQRWKLKNGTISPDRK
jgi:hypothetical protein